MPVNVLRFILQNIVIVLSLFNTWIGCSIVFSISSYSPTFSVFLYQNVIVIFHRIPLLRGRDMLTVDRSTVPNIVEIDKNRVSVKW